MKSLFGGLCVSAHADPRARKALMPARILNTWGRVENSSSLLEDAPSQPYLGGFAGCTLINSPGAPRAAVMLDFGAEINGRLRLIFNLIDGGVRSARARIRLGESAMEALTPLGEKNATNDHALRDTETPVGALSRWESQETGFRFAYIELLSDGQAQLAGARAELVYADLPYIGEFECDDALVNRIWEVSARTAHLCIQDYLWDGIKRDRLVWMGDMHTELMTSLCVFGACEAMTKSMDFMKSLTPPGEWMNGMPSYSLWWLLSVRDYYLHTGDIEYLRAQAAYAGALGDRLCALISDTGEELLPGKFLDWPNSDSAQAQHAGMQGLITLALDAAADIALHAGDQLSAPKYSRASALARSFIPDCAGSKQAAALNILAGIGDAAKLNASVLSPGGARGYSTFMGLYTLRAKALAGDCRGALDDMKAYWGGMLSLGATSFWEDFSLDWLNGAGRIDELVPEGMRDPHGDYGAYCYKQFRHSLCHGWSSGPAPYIMHNVLGITPIAPGYSRARVAPRLDGLCYARGACPTPYGTIRVECERAGDGLITRVDAPEGVEICK